MAETSNLTLSSVVKRKESPLSAQVAGRTVLMSVEQGQYYDLDTVSTDVWSRLASPIDVATLCAELADRYDGAIDVIQSDVLTLLSAFADHGLIEIRSA